MTTYQCAACGAPAEVTPENVVRSCAHTGTVIANCTATVYGVSVVE